MQKGRRRREEEQIIKYIYVVTNKERQAGWMIFFTGRSTGT
jgi:hypothetical protein